MITFQLREVVRGADWHSVTEGMAPDEIKYVVRTEEAEIRQQDSLTSLLALYVSVADLSGDAPDELAAFDVERTDGRVRLGERVFSQAISYDGDVGEIGDALGDLLAEVFDTLDERSSPEQRQSAFGFLSSTLGVDMDRLYDSVSRGSDSSGGH